MKDVVPTTELSEYDNLPCVNSIAVTYINKDIYVYSSLQNTLKISLSSFEVNSSKYTDSFRTTQLISQDKLVGTQARDILVHVITYDIHEDNTACMSTINN